MDEFISVIESCSEQLNTNNSGFVDEIALGEMLWQNMIHANPCEKDQEAAVSKHAEIIIKAVRDFSDYKDCFCEIHHYLSLGIERLSSKTALKCAKACSIMWGTEDGDERYQAEWANTSIRRCMEWITVSSVDKLFDPILLNNIKIAQLLLEEVANAGEEYRDLIKSNNTLHNIISNTQIVIDEGFKIKSIKKEMTNQLTTIQKILSTIAALNENNLLVIIENLEKSVDINKPNSKLLFEAYNTICDETEDCLLVQLAISQNNNNKLLQLAIYGINVQTEASKKNKNLLLESLVFLQLLLLPWDKNDQKHMEMKTEIATNIYQYTTTISTGTTVNIMSGLLKQLLFWQNEWEGCYGDCSLPCLQCLLQLIQFFPSIIEEHILPNPSIIVLIHSISRIISGSGSTEYESDGSVAKKIMLLLDGKYDHAGLIGTTTTGTTSTTAFTSTSDQANTSSNTADTSNQQQFKF